jgi:hypothetical protein
VQFLLRSCQVLRLVVVCAASRVTPCRPVACIVASHMLRKGHGTAGGWCHLVTGPHRWPGVPRPPGLVAQPETRVQYAVGCL